MGTMWGTMTPYDEHKTLIIKALSKRNGGESGIRTHGRRITPTHAFQACSFNHSDISPRAGWIAQSNRPSPALDQSSRRRE